MDPLFFLVVVVVASFVLLVMVAWATLGVGGGGPCSCVGDGCPGIFWLWLSLNAGFVCFPVCQWFVLLLCCWWWLPPVVVVSALDSFGCLWWW